MALYLRWTAGIKTGELQWVIMMIGIFLIIGTWQIITSFLTVSLARPKTAVLQIIYTWQQRPGLHLCASQNFQSNWPMCQRFLTDCKRRETPGRFLSGNMKQPLLTAIPEVRATRPPR